MAEQEISPLVSNNNARSPPTLCCGPCLCEATFLGSAFDLVVIRSTSRKDSLACNDPVFKFWQSAWPLQRCMAREGGNRVVLEIDIEMSKPIHFPIVKNKIWSPEGLGSPMVDRITTDSDDAEYHHKEALIQLASFLYPGRNFSRYLLLNESGDVLAVAPMNVYLWTDQDRVICCDIDGTITRSDIGGIIDTLVTEQYTYCHDGVCEFLSSLVGFKVLYLSSRPLYIADRTRKFLTSVSQEDGKFQLPAGPFIGFAGTLAGVLKMEHVTHSVNATKFKALQQHIITSFAKVDVTGNIFVAGFGNTPMDAQAYHSAGMSLHQIYIVDKESKIYCLDSDSGVKDSSSRDEYMRARGSLFGGYKDEQLKRRVVGYVEGHL